MIYGHIPPPTTYELRDEIATLRSQLAAAEARVERLLRGEFICQKCGLRKDGEHDGKPDF